MSLPFWIVWTLLGAGAGLLAVGGLKSAGFERDRSTYPLVLIFIALTYVALAVGAGREVMALAEAALAVPFVAMAVAGFHYGRWLVVVGLALHGAYDLLHDQVLETGGVPGAYHALCLGFDLVLAGRVAMLRARNMTS